MKFYRPPRKKTWPAMTLQEEVEHLQGCIEMISAGYRALAVKLHPDAAGGSTEEMERLNRVRDRLLRREATR
jgi:hypothetical protein